MRREPRGGSLLVWGVYGALLTAACIAAALIKERRAFGAFYLVSSCRSTLRNLVAGFDEIAALSELEASIRRVERKLSPAKAAPKARHCFIGLAPRAQAAMGLAPTQRGRSICSALDSPHLQGLSQPAEPRRARCAPASSFLSMAFSCKPRSYAAFSSRDMAFS